MNALAPISPSAEMPPVLITQEGVFRWTWYSIEVLAEPLDMSGFDPHLWRWRRARGGLTRMSFRTEEAVRRYWDLYTEHLRKTAEA